MFSLIKSGMATAMHELSVVSNNIANANSNGFKKTLVAFSELGDRFGAEQVDSSKTGQGASLGASRRSDGQGAIIETNRKTDFALIGNGMFILKKNPSSVTPTFSRNGSFSLDNLGFLRASNDAFVMGAPLVDGAFGPTPTDLDGLQPIQIPLTREDAPMSELKILGDGSIAAAYGTEVSYPLSTITLGLFSSNSGLKELGGGSYSQTDKSGVVSLGAPTDLGYASLRSGGLEASNVNITDELTAMIKAQQQFNGSARLMQTNSEMVEKLTR
jgi:flagellar basal-body rod protein FlgG